MQHADELLQIVVRNFLGCEFVFELFFDFFQARFPIQHLQDGVFLFMKTEIVEPDRLLQHPKTAAMITMLPRAQIWPHGSFTARDELLIKLSAKVAISC